MRLAFWHTDLSRKGPGLLLRDVLRGDPQVSAVAAGLVQAGADVVVLADVDYDHGLVTLGALRDLLVQDGVTYPHMIAIRPNKGIDTGVDLDGDGRLGMADDAQGYGRFGGQGGLAVLSRHPIALTRDHSTVLWRDLPGSLIIDYTGHTGSAAKGAAVQRLATVAHVEVVVTPARAPPVTLMIFHAGPPVFDGPEDRNGRRNHDEVIFWRHRLDGAFGAPPDRPVLIGAANLAPEGGDGRNLAIRTLLADPRLTDPPGLRDQPTVDWPAPGPGQLRVDYILPAVDLPVVASGVMAADPQASRHRLIWVDLDQAASRSAAASGN
ncbi:endonuclease/exonuclease/phosphatase family protein [Pseudooceanicola onchidii]|uniref:endonuclease/exonuclease/phosphatase family protein n=1 Tax=Pseudooceanicola onchidii TaxID=2562279 RepID=UPI001F0D5187|nr:endonuclease/exonuclease/phosphatase family protein [Pseudooceanicola onchidii]